MTLIAPKTKSNFTPAPQGTHIARCIRIIQIGTNMEQFKGEDKEMNKIRVTFELPEELKVFKEGDDAKPVVIDQEYTLAMSEKANLRKLVEGMIGSMTDAEADIFDIESLIGRACLITIKHKTSKAGNLRAEIAGASPLMKGQVCKEAFNEYKVLSYNNWNEEYFNTLPEFIKTKMMTSKEYLAMKGEVKGNEIPF